MTMTTVKLGGRLGQEFGHVWHLDIDRPSEAVRAIEANRPGFAKRIADLADMGLVFRVRLNKRPVDEKEIEVRHGGQTLTIMPIVRGAGAVGRIVIGAALIAASFMMPATWAFAAQAALSVGASMVIGGVVQLLSPQPKVGASSSSSSVNSYSFGNTENVAGQGYAIPVGYGRMLVGSIAVAAGMYAENMGAYADTNPTLS